MKIVHSFSTDGCVRQVLPEPCGEQTLSRRPYEIALMFINMADRVLKRMIDTPVVAEDNTT